VKLIINDIPPSNNQFIGNSKNFNIYRREKERWHWLIKAAGRPPAKPLQKAIVTITYFFPDKRRRDPDNYSGKMILDPLTREGYITDDSFDHVELRLVGSYDKKNSRTEIEIEATI
jgi:Holliday junction resolvase RusA-like endonuclease